MPIKNPKKSTKTPKKAAPKKAEPKKEKKAATAKKGLRSARLELRLSNPEAAALRGAARAAGITLSAWVRSVLAKAAAR